MSDDTVGQIKQCPSCKYPGNIHLLNNVQALENERFIVRQLRHQSKRMRIIVLTILLQNLTTDFIYKSAVLNYSH